ncbi:MAG: NADAR family protein [Kofleriaceae bacterium]
MPTETRAGYTFFWRPDSPFSQWHPCTFIVEGRRFGCAEQFMMHGKAVLFDDAEVAAQILAAADPRSHKALGRKVRGFDDRRWKQAREGIVYAGNHAKFTQHPALLAALRGTAGTTLVEASPMDRIWGIGMASSHPLATDPTRWRGLNLLGNVLTRLRDDLIAAAPSA